MASRRTIKEKIFKKELLIVFGIFLGVCIVRLFYAFSTPHFSSDFAYYLLRNMEHIQTTLLPLFEDPLSYGGRSTFLLPLFYYVLSFFGKILGNEIAVKVIPNLFASSLVFIVYIFCKELTSKKELPLLGAFFAGCIPLFISQTLNSGSILSISVPFLFLALYFFVKSTQNRMWILPLVTTLLLLRMTTTTVFFLLLTMGLYLLLLKVEGKKIMPFEGEVVLFTTFLLLWTLFVGFKRLFLENGFSVLWENAPSKVLESYFSSFDIVSAVYLMGLLGVILGGYGLYKTFGSDHRPAYLLASFVLILLAAIWAHIIPLTSGLVYLSVTLLLLSIYGVSTLPNTKMGVGLLIVLGIIMYLIPSMFTAASTMDTSYDDSLITVLDWAFEGVPPREVIAAPLSYGHVVTYFSKSKNIMDGNFVLISRVDEIYDDLHALYATPSEIQALTLMQKYESSFLLAIGEPPSYTQTECFTPVFSQEEVTMFKRRCSLG